MKKSTPPSILAIRTVAKSHLFEIQAVDLRFSNGIERTYERFHPFNRDSVMAIAIDGADLLLVREYAMGTEQYELGFVKGAMDVGETPAQSANRELQEEIGVGAHKWTHLRTLKINPQIMGHNMHVLLGEDLYSNQLEGDEPEPLDIVRYPLAHLEELLLDGTFNEARNLAALYTLRDFLKKHQ